MATNSTTPTLPNPFTPLAFLPPDIAEQFQAEIYISIAALSAFIWDLLLSIPEEIQMCHQRKISLVVIMYFISRIGTLANGTLVIILETASVANCNAVKNASAASFILAGPLTSALFFFRVKAVYRNNKIVTAFFGFLLLSFSGLSFVYPFSYKAAHLGTTQRCTASQFAWYGSVPALMSSIFDTLVFIAISLRILSYAMDGNTFSARMKSFLRGHGLPNLSRSLLQGGQLYYFATIGLNIAVVATALAPINLTYRTMFFQPHIALNNAMACRVFRGIRLGIIQDVDGDTENRTTILQFAPSHGPHPSQSSGVKSPRTVLGFEGSRVPTEIMKNTESTGPQIYAGRDPGHFGGYDNQDDNKSVTLEGV